MQLGFAEAGASLPLIRENKLRALAVSSHAFAEAAGDGAVCGSRHAPDFEAVSWHMLYAPAATPKAIVDRFHDEMKKIMRDPEMKQMAWTIGLLPIDTPSLAETEKYLAGEREKWG